MKKTFIATVGTGKGVENGLRFSIESNNPSKVYLIVTQDSVKTAESVRDSFNDREIEFTQFIYIKDENDVDSIFMEISRKLMAIIDSGISPREITADYTSGTKAMSAALVLSAIEYGIEKISYVYGSQRDPETGRVLTGSERLSVLTPNTALEKRVIEQAVRLYHLYQFKAATQLLDEHTFSARRKPYVDILKQLIEGHDKWDKFEFEDAVKLFSNLSKEQKEKIREIKVDNELNKVNAWLRTLLDDESGEKRVVDMFYNACRRGEEGKYDDAVARLYRTLEMIIQNEYKLLYGKTTEVGLMDTWRAIENSDTPVVRLLNQNKDEVMKILYSRNHSILAHGSNPVKPEIYEKFKGVIQGIILPDREVRFMSIHAKHFHL